MLHYANVQVNEELAQKKALIRTDSSTRAVAELEDTIELLRGELDELRQVSASLAEGAGTVYWTLSCSAMSG